MRAVVLVLVLAGCRQIFGLHELTASKDDAAGTGDGPPGDTRRLVDSFVGFDVGDAPAGFHHVGGTAGGLVSGGGIMVTTNGQTTGRTGDGTWVFPSGIADGTSYDVMLVALPPGEQCTVTHATGTVSGVDVTDVYVDCREPGIACAGSYCTPSDYCCASSSGASCQAAGSPCPGAQLTCDDASDCSLLICCGYLDTSGNVTSSSCDKAGNCASSPGVILCDPTAANPCAFGTCLPVNAGGLPPGYYSCQ